MTLPANQNAATSKLSLTNHPMGDSLKYSVLLELLAQLEPNFGRMLDLMVLMCSLSWQLSAR